MTSTKNSGGGVLIAVHSKIASEQFQLSVQNLEHLCVKLSFNSKKLYLYVIYIPPNSAIESYINCGEAITEIYNTAGESDGLLITGDFNLTNIKWEYDSDLNTLLPFNVNSETEGLFTDTIHNLNLNQINNIANERGKFLDLILTNDLDVFHVSESMFPFVINDINHMALEISFDHDEFINTNSSHVSSKWFYNFKKMNLEIFKQYLETINWEAVFGDGDINIDIERYYDIMYKGFDQHVPISKERKTVHPPWYDDVLVNLKNVKNKHYAKMKKSKQEGDRLIFLESNKQFDSYFNQKYKEYISGIQDKIKHDPKHFWNFFKSKSNVKSFPSTMQYDENTSSDSQQIADYFAKFFQSVYKPEDVDRYRNPHGLSTNVLISLPTFTEEDVVNALKEFKDGGGPDNIPSFILKCFVNELKKPLCHLYNKSLSSGIFPDKWKVSKISPIYKAGSRSDVSCYRGVASTSSMPKLLEFMVCNSFKKIIPRHLSVHQHGFMPCRSTTTNLLEFTSKTTRAMENHYQVDTVYTDFSKAFDSISHCKALESLFNFGFSNQFVMWFKSYLTNRTQFVEVGDAQSTLIKVTSGVPQGSHVGPWLFIIFIDGTTSVIKHSDILVFADDLKIYRNVQDISDTEKLQEDINSLTKWCELNALHLNTNKCKVMSFYRKSNPIIANYHINNATLQRVVEIKDLGVTFVENMTFNKHIDLAIAKANSMLGFIKRWTKDISDQRTLFILYFAYVRSQLEYAVSVWCPYYTVHIKRIESVQKRFLLYITWKNNWDYDHDLPYYENVRRLPPYINRCKNFNLTTLVNRRHFLGASIIGNTILGFIDSPFLLENIQIQVPSRNLRSNRLLHLHTHRTNYGENEPVNQMTKVFNTVDNLFEFGSSKEGFKNKLKKHFLNN